MHFVDGVLHIGSVPLTDLASRFGTPFYIYDAAVLRRQLERVQRAFEDLPFKPFYAMKANANLAILRLVRDHGFGCDAVSPGEVYLAKCAGVASREIWFTCSNVSDEDLRNLGDPDVVVNVNSMSEIDRVLALDLPNPIALRVNPDVGAGHHHDVVTAGVGVKFGIDLAELPDARMVIEDSGRRVVGLHAHIGSGVTDIAPLIEAARRLLELVPDFASLQWVNFGGGIAIPYKPGEAEFDIQEYGRQLSLLAGNLLRARDLTAVLEPGRFVVAQAGTLVARVTTRRMSTGIEWIGCDTGFNHLARPSKYGAYHHIVNASRGSEGSLRATFDPSLTREPVVVAGNICESGDVFTRDEQGPRTRDLDPTRVGDLLAFCDAGAYGFSMASHYNSRLMLPEILVDGDEVRLIRERQTFDDLLKGMA
jgi:diaminopimelate decarboxylase